MARILGLDLGSHSIKVVALDSAAKDQSIRAFAEAPLGNAPWPEATLAALKQLLENPVFSSDQVVVSLPGATVATHLLTLPFSDIRKVEATLGFELEGQLPFDLSESVYDYQLVTSSEKGSELLVAVARKQEMAALLELLSQAGVDPKIVTHPGLAYHPFFESLVLPDAGDGSAVALVDIGHERTCVAAGRPGAGIELSRIFGGGGAALTRGVAAEMAIPLETAATWKETQGALGRPGATPEAARAVTALAKATQPLVRELRATLKAYSAHWHRPVGRVFLCGGTARLLGLDEQLSRELKIPCERLALPQLASEVVPEPHRPIAAQACALALRGQPTGRNIRCNLRRGEFSYKASLDYVRSRVKTLAAMAAALFILFVGFGIARNVAMGNREKQVDNRLCEVTKQVLGTCEKNYERALNMLQGKESPAGIIPKMSAVALLAALTEKIPQDVSVTFDQVQIDLERIVLRGETENSKQVDKITGSLKEFRCFREVKQGKVEKSKSGNKVNFNLDIQVQCPEAGVTQG